MQKIRFLKHLGQNFLIDKNVVRKIIKTAELKSTDIVLEIGPGPGVLTKEIAKYVKGVIAVEKDPRMIEILKENLKEFKNIKIIQGDILKFNFQFSIPNFQSISNDSIFKNYKIVANLPFYITAPAIRKFLESENPPKTMVLIIQKEMAQRICAKPPKMNLLAVSVQFYAKPKIISYVPKKSFKPKPKVDAAIIKIAPQNKNRGRASADAFFRIVRAGFSHPRKQLVNNLLALNLPNGLKLNKKELSALLLKHGIKTSQRAETLTIDDWLKLSKMLNPVRD